MQNTLGERLKFLLDHFGISARKLSRELGVPESNTQNYLPPTPREPGAYYLERLLNHYESVNAHWLLTGQGEPWVRYEDGSIADEFKKYEAQTQNQKNNKGAIFNNQGHATYTTLADCEKDLKSLQEKYALLTSQLQDKERIIRLYEAQQPNP